MKKTKTHTVDSKVRTCWQVISRMYNIQAMQFQEGATLAMVHFILNIDSKEGAYASEIAPRLGMEGSSLSRIIQTLENEKFITKQSDSKDKRKVKLMLTDIGREHKEIAKDNVRTFNKLVEEKIGTRRKEEFFETLDIITDLAEEQLQKIKKT